MIFVFVDIITILEARNIYVRAFNLPKPHEEDTREVEEMDRIARRRRLPKVTSLQLSGDLEHSRTCFDKSINGDDNDNFKFNNGQRSVFDTLMEATYDEIRHSIAYLISSAGGTGNTYFLNTRLTINWTGHRIYGHCNNPFETWTHISFNGERALL
jgi:hypothetical protein